MYENEMYLYIRNFLHDNNVKVVTVKKTFIELKNSVYILIKKKRISHHRCFND